MAYLNQRGYIIVKDLNLPEPLKKIRKDLTVKPIVNTNYTFGRIPKFEVFMENEKKLYIPTFYGITEHAKGEVERMDNRIPEGTDIFIRFTGKLRPNQIEPTNICIKAFEDRTKRGGILQLPPGYGKTICAVYLICKLGKKALIIVNKEFLMSQWIDRIRQVCPTARVGIIQQKKFDIEDKDIVVGMLQTLSFRKFDTRAFESFGLTVWDEVHNVSTETFSKSMFKLGTKYRLGLSATPERPDGLSKVFKWHLGEIVYSIEQERKGLQPIAKIYRLKPLSEEENCDTVYLKEQVNKAGEPNIPIMLTEIGKDPTRNQLILDLIAEFVNEGRHLLVLSERVAHLKYLHQTYSKTELAKDHTGALYIGATSQKDRDLSNEASVIFGSVKLVSEAYDNPKLDTLIFACFNGGPMANRPATAKLMDQTTGRIFRKVHTDRPAIVVDIQDTFSVFKGQGYRRAAYYRKNKYQTETFQIKETGKKEYSTKEQKTSAEKPIESTKLTGFLIIEEN